LKEFGGVKGEMNQGKGAIWKEQTGEARGYVPGTHAMKACPKV